MHWIYECPNTIQLYRPPFIAALPHQCNAITEIKSLPVTLIGTTSVWTACACCRIFSSGVGSGRDLVQLVWVLISDNSFVAGLLGLLMVISFSSSGGETGHYKQKYKQQCEFTTKKIGRTVVLLRCCRCSQYWLLVEQNTPSQISHFDLHKEQF